MNENPTGLQFDKAEFDSSVSASCAFCKRPGLTSYFDINGKVTCDACRAKIAAQVAPEDVPYAQAFLLGLGAAIVSGVAYGFTRKLTGANIGLVSVAVGWFVGTAVRRGAGQVGGRPQQVMAVLLSYLAVAASFLPVVVPAYLEKGYAGLSLVVASSMTALMAPAYEGSPLGYLIYGFALWQAFRVTRPVNVQINGPFQVSTRPPGTGVVSGG